MDYSGDFKNLSGKRVHMIGIGGSSMSGLALLLKGRGALVSGSDRASVLTLDKLKSRGIEVFYKHAAENVTGAQYVVYTAAIAEDNPERMAAHERGIPLIERSNLLGLLSNMCDRSICVAGTHGKTTTTSMIATLLLNAGLNPTIHIGGELDLIGGSVRQGGSEWFLTEADEFKYSFLTLIPYMAILTNIDADHLDVFGDIQGVEAAFTSFLSNVRQDGAVIACGDDERAGRIARGADRRLVTYGFGEGNLLRGVNVERDTYEQYSFDVEAGGEKLCSLSLSVPGKHAALNALATVAAGRELGIPMEVTASALHMFTNPRRRFEHTGDIDGVALYHDYGHNPTEYRSVVPLARKRAQGRLFVVFQPHTYSRVKTLFDQFLTAFPGADTVLVTDIYAAREVDPGDIHATQLIAPMRAAGVDAVYTPTFEDCKQYLNAHWRPSDLVLTVGCGDVNLLNTYLLE